MISFLQGLFYGIYINYEVILLLSDMTPVSVNLQDMIRGIASIFLLLAFAFHGLQRLRGCGVQCSLYIIPPFYESSAPVGNLSREQLS